ncbi:MAG TPA: class I SAM-dependent methyltransferase [Solidesulfovibrio magneticus]|nr:class I SAM-dependent methyltransferase [Solidesulfovibrio magneticus]
MDSWFSSHYVQAARIACGLLAQYMPLAGTRILDFGCGDGITAAGAAALGVGFVVGVDVHPSFAHLAERLAANTGSPTPPANLAFVQSGPDCRLPFAPGSFDAAYSWSVFEHLPDIPAALDALRLALRPGGHCLIQIDPLYCSPYGSHLRRLVDRPWAHLLMSNAAFVALAEAAGDHDANPEKDDLLYAQNDFAAYKKHLVEQFLDLNRLTVRQLLHHVEGSGLVPVRLKTTPVSPEHVPPPQLLCVHSRDDLLTSTVYLVLRR